MPKTKTDNYSYEHHANYLNVLKIIVHNYTVIVFAIIIKQHVFCVSESDKPLDECLLWRLSFSYAEKKIMRAADYSAVKSDVDTRRKDLVRLLKADVENWAKKCKLSTKDLSPVVNSFVIKMTSLHMYEEFEYDDDWTEDNLARRHYQALNFLLDSLQPISGSPPKLSNYFLPSHNILEHLATKPDRTDLCQLVCTEIALTMKQLKEKIKRAH